MAHYNKLLSVYLRYFNSLSLIMDKIKLVDYTI